jgi:hypothetical protein
MKAYLKDDIIIKTNLTKGVEIGNKPSKIGWERVRWDGKKLIDLNAERDTKYIDPHGIMHCIELPGTQPVFMKWSERKRLRRINGTWFLLSEEAMENEKAMFEETLMLNKRKVNYPSKGDQLDAILRYLEKQNDLTEELEGVITKWKDIKAKFPKGE